MGEIERIIKRDGRVVEFSIDKISDAIFNAARVLGGRDREMATYLAKQVELYLLEVCHTQLLRLNRYRTPSKKSL